MSTSAAPSEAGEAERSIPLSLNQAFLLSFDKGTTDGAFGHRHTLTGALRVSGEIDADALKRALDEVVRRHEVLRTRVHAGEDGGHQEVCPAGPVPLAIRELDCAAGQSREERAEAFLNEIDATPFDVRELPHLRAFLGRFDKDDAVLVLTTHHTSTDAWSLQVITRDLLDGYGRHAAGNPAGAGPVAQYQEFSRWQQSGADAARLEKAGVYWGARLEGSQITGVTSDRPRDEQLTSDYGVHRFAFDKDLSTRTGAFARSTRSTPFMVLAAAYSVLLRHRCGVTDVVFPTFSSGRYEERFLDSVGPFFNFVPIRVDTGGCATFGDVADRAREACIGAYQHEIPFAHIAGSNPGLLAPFADASLAVIAFEVLQAPLSISGQRAGDAEFSEIRRRTQSQRVSSAIPDGGLWAMDVLPDGELVGSLKFDHHRFDEESAVRLVTDFRALLDTLVSSPDTPLDQG